MDRWLSKAFWATWRIAVPFLFFEGVSSPLTFVALFVTAEWMTGWYLAFNFQARKLFSVFVLVVFLFVFVELCQIRKR